MSVAVILALLLCVREEMNYKTGQSFQSKGFSFMSRIPGVMGRDWCRRCSKGIRAVSMDYGGFNVQVLWKEDLKTFQMDYPEVDVKAALAEGGAILYCRPVTTGAGKQVENDLFQEGGKITFGWLEPERAMRRP